MDVRDMRRADRDGNTIRQYVIDGLVLPVLKGLPERLAKLGDFSADADDVFLFAFPKSGTHWTWEIVNLLVRGKADHVTFGKDHVMFEFVDLPDLRSQPRPRVINSHLPFRFVPNDVLKKRNKIIHVLRNPKDVAVSCYNHHYNYHAWEYDGKWPAYLDMFLKGQVGWCYEGEGWFGYVREWEQATIKYPDVPVLFVYYEDLQKNPLECVKRIAAFLDVHREPEFYEDVIRQCSFSSMRTAKNNFYSDEEKGHWRNNEPKIFRKGAVGGWREWFTGQQNEDFDKMFEKEMNGSSLIFTF